VEFLEDLAMTTPDFFRARLEGMVDPRHPMVVLAGRLPWAQIEQVLAPHFQRKARTPGAATVPYLLDELKFGGGVGAGGRPRLPIRPMASLLYLKNSFNLSDEELVAR
jgi:IS5 family transposase